MSEGVSTTCPDSINPDWYEVPSLPGFRVSTTGRVQTRRIGGRASGNRGEVPRLGEEWREMKVQSLPNGYRYVHVRDVVAGRRRIIYVHAMVAECFIGPRPNELDVCHENNDRGDNRPGNLRYGTRLENMADQLAHGTRIRGSAHGNSKLTERRVRAILNMIARGTKDREIANRIGISRPTVTMIRNGKLWVHVNRPCAQRPDQLAV